MRRRRWFFAWLLLLGASLAAPVHAQTAPVPSSPVSPAPAASPASGAGDAPLNFLPVNLDAQAALDAPVSLDAPRLPVAQALSQIERQCGVQLTLPPELEHKNLVVLFQKRPVREVMRALSSLYGLDWSSNDPHRFLAGFSASPFERAALHLGDMNEISARQLIRSQGPQGLAPRLLALGLDTAQLSRAQGVPLSSLAPSLREELQQGKRLNAALDTLRPLALQSRFALLGGRVRLVTQGAPGTASAQATHFHLFNRDGAFLADLGVLTPPPAPTPTP